MRLLPALLLACAPPAVSTDVDRDSGRDTAPVVDSQVHSDTGESDPPDSVPPDTDPGPRWERMAPLLPARQEHGAAVLRGEVVVVGGYVASGPLRRVDAWSPESDTWRPLADVPEALHHPNLAVVGDTLVVAGFLTGIFPNFVPKGTVYRYDADADRWDTGTPMPEGTARGAAVTLVHDARVFVLGGLGGDAVTTASVYDPALDSWTPLPPLATARDHATGGVLGGALVVAGGRAISTDTNKDAVEAYTPGEGWSARAPLPRPRGGVVGGTVGDRLYVLGGEGNPDDLGLMFADLDAYDALLDTWTSLDPMPLPVHGSGAVTLDDRLWIPGGGTRAGLQPTDALQAFNPLGR